jgi:hypothetical protein
MRAGGRPPIRSLITHIKHLHALTNPLGDARDPHGEGVRGVEHKIGFAVAEEIREALLREAANVNRQAL